MLAVMSIAFFFCGWRQVRFIWNKQQTTEQMLHMDRVWSKKWSQTEPKRRWTGEVTPGPGPVLLLILSHHKALIFWAANLESKPWRADCKCDAFTIRHLAIPWWRQCTTCPALLCENV